MSIALVIMFLGTAVLISVPLGRYLTWAMSDPVAETGLRVSMERVIVWVTGPAARREQNWKQYCLALLLFNVCMFIFVFAVLSIQQHLPLNPDRLGSIEPSLVFNTVVSFVTNTNLQHYSGESTLSYFSQLGALMWLQFVSAATGIAALAAMARGLSGSVKIGNFYRDLLRATLLFLVPVAFVVATTLVLGGIAMTFGGAIQATTLEGAVQTIARGPVAAFVTIKQLGTNGGGFFGPNSTHSYENVSFFTNCVECLCIIIIPMASVWMFGRITGRMRHAAVIFTVMMMLFVCKVSWAVCWESEPTASFAGLPVSTESSNLEGKELRFGATAAPFWATATTSTSNGSVNAMHNSLNPLTGLAPLAGMWLNVTFGGVGVGMINMFIYIIIGVFICGMMVGRTPEYLARKVETREMKLALIALLLHPLCILGGTAAFAATSWGIGTVKNPGARGFTEILYEFSSAAANNGSGYEGLGDNTIPWNLATGLVMLFCRYVPIILPLAIAGSLAAKKPVPESTGTFRTDTPMFGLVLLGSVALIGALLFLPVAVLGPIAEHLAGTL
ncbi:MAG: potassium-transporting ATPase potassium-binding subunit [Candidatus Hydrogenedentota bacterium]